ncbi:MAG: metallophosphoesterase family protein [Candidatus Nanohaloarchaeota archaeon QJJ-5]|nr:metallophosphoesterase family protein [Candidatus Nanohaloarchaeota archaeon QJJ-5]
MRILAAADFHEDENLLEAVIEEANSGSYDVLIAPGDFVTPDDFERVRDETEIPSIACTGNWDFNFEPPGNDEYEDLYNYAQIDFGKDIKIGLIGAVFPDDFVDEMIEWADGIDNRKLLYMSHYPPERLGDATVSGNRAGFAGFRELILKTKPAAWFCGHIHESFGQYHLMKTEVFNCATIESRKAFAVELGDDGVESADEVDLE